MHAQQWVAVWLIGNLAAVGMYDVFSSWFFGPDSTVTHVLRNWSLAYPALPFLAGLLMGHLFAW